MNNKKKYCIIGLMLGASVLGAQDKRVVEGRVVNGADGTPVSGALVGTAEIEGFSTLTDAEGRYQLTVPDYATSLVVTAPDFLLQRQGIGQGQQSDIRLYSDKFHGHYGERTVIDGKASANIPAYSSAVTVEEEIERTLGGYVRTTGRSGVPGIGREMFIGGINSIHAAAQPLIVVDGVILDQQYDRTCLHAGFYNDILANINPADIEQVTVVRNGVALYGAKGANGVILINTRRNHSMATRITASMSFGLTDLPKFLDMMSAEQYRSYASELLKTSGATKRDFKFLNNDPDYYYYQKYHNETDWKQEVYRRAFTQNYGINIGGGDDVAGYNLSLGYMNGQSTMVANEMSRLNIRFNADVKFTDRLSMRFDASFVNQRRNLRNDGAPADYSEGTPTSPAFLAYAKSPFLSPYTYTNGVIAHNHIDVEDEDYLDEVLANVTTNNYKLANPYAIIKYGEAENKNHFENSMLNVSLMPRYAITPHLAVSEHFSYNLTSTNEKYYIPIYGVPDYYIYTLAATRENEVRSLFGRQNAIMSDTRIDWQRRFDGHNVGVMGGVRVNHDQYSVDKELGYNTGNDKTPFLSSGLSNPDTYGTCDTWTNIAWYAQGNYDWLQRYYLQLNLTAETSSRFGVDASDGVKMAGARWGLFPGVQAGWVMSNEEWLAGNPVVGYLKLSAGCEVSGNDDIARDAARSYFAAQRYKDKILGLSLANIGNSKIQWETTRKWNAAVEANLLHDRVHVDVNFFRSETENLLLLGQLGILTGLENSWRNDGTLANTGYDINLSGRIIHTRDWQWELGVSVAHYSNEVKRLAAGQSHLDTQIYGATVRSEIGASANTFYGYKSLGVFSTAADAASANLYQMGSNGIDKSWFGAGDVHFADLDGNGRIDEADRTRIGDPNPDLYGSIRSSLCYKRFRLEVDGSYSIGNDVYNYQRQQLESGSRFMNQTTALARRWHGEGHVTDVPQCTYQDPMGNSRFSDRWIEDGSYFKLRSVTLSYRHPVSMQFVQGFEFWVQANNLFTATKYLGSDPETSFTTSVIGQGIDIGLLPASRSYYVGVKINL